MSDQVETQFSMSNVKARSTWLRGLYMLLFAVIYGVAKFVCAAIILLQFVLLVLTGRPNEQLRQFSGKLAAFMYEILLFLTFNSEAKPYPFGPWPDGPAARPPA
jgi:hypothetical protein